MKKILLIIILMFAVSSVFAFELGVSTSLLNKVKVTYTLEDYNKNKEKTMYGKGYIEDILKNS